MGHQLLPHIYAPDSPGRDKIEQQKIIDHHAFDHMIRFNQVKAEDLDVPEHTKTAQSSKSWLQLLLYAVAGSLLLLGLFVLWNVRDWCMTGLSVSVGHIERMVKTTGPWAVVWCATALTVAVVLASICRAPDEVVTSCLTISSPLAQLSAASLSPRIASGSGVPGALALASVNATGNAVMVPGYANIGSPQKLLLEEASRSRLSS